MATVGVLPEVWRTRLARVYARDIGDAQADITRFKIGEGGFINVPPKEPVVPLPDRRDLESEGEPLPGGGTATFTNASATVTGIGTTFLADLAPGQWIKPGPTPAAAVGSAGTPGTEIDDWGRILTVDNDLQVTLTAAYIGGTLGGRPVHVADEPLYTFRKDLLVGDVIMVSAVPAVIEITSVVLAGEANVDQLGNAPEFFEIGGFDANGVMVFYVTFDIQTKIPAIQLNSVTQIEF